VTATVPAFSGDRRLAAMILAANGFVLVLLSGGTMIFIGRPEQGVSGIRAEMLALRARSRSASVEAATTVARRSRWPLWLDI
jgi:hypothetical protein